MSSAYLPDPSTKDTPLTRDEVRVLLESGPKVLRDSRVAGHVLSRVVATLDAHRRETRELHRQVQHINAALHTRGAATTLDARDAAKFLPPEEIDAMASAHLRSLLEHSRAVHTEILDAQRRVTGRVNAIKFAVATLLEDPTLDDATRQRFLELVRSMPDPTPEQLDGFAVPSAAELDAQLASTSGPHALPAGPAPGSAPPAGLPPSTPTPPAAPAPTASVPAPPTAGPAGVPATPTPSPGPSAGGGLTDLFE